MTTIRKYDSSGKFLGTEIITTEDLIKEATPVIEVKVPIKKAPVKRKKSGSNKSKGSEEREQVREADSGASEDSSTES